MANPSLVTAPAHLPVTVGEFKAHRRIEQDDNTELTAIGITLKAATAFAETFCNRRFVTQTLDYTVDEFPNREFISLPGGGLQSITSLTYTESDDTSTVWTSTNYFASTTHEPGRLVLAYGISWPSVTLKPADAVVIRYIVGYGTGDQVPDDIRNAILIIAGDMWENREDAIIGQGLTPVKIPRGAEALLWPHRIHTF